MATDMTMDEWDPMDDINQAKMRGLAFLATLVICVALFLGGVCFPLVQVVIMPGIDEVEHSIVLSVFSIIALCWENSQIGAFFVLLAVTVGIPMLLLSGIFLILYENFFAVAFGRSTYFTPGWRALGMSVMYISTSYQVVILFLITLFTCFFTGFGSVAHLRIGFFFLAGYCLSTIGMLQAMEYLKLNSDEPDADEDRIIPSITGLNLRQRLSSVFPSLPGVKETVHVDSFQVFWFCSLFAVLLLLGYTQPLLDIQVMYKGIALERRTVSLADMITTLAESSYSVAVIFFILVIAIPVLYSLVLCITGVFDTCALLCCADQASTINTCLLWIAAFLRPWVMTDVFSIALVIVLYVVQNEYISATIPEGIVVFWQHGIPTLAFGRAAKEAAAKEEGMQAYWLSQAISGIFMVVGAGIATIFLRWFWSASRRHEQVDPTRLSDRSLATAASSRANDSHRTDSHRTEEGRTSSQEIEENYVTKNVASKSCRCLVVWAVSCFVLHQLPLPTSDYELQDVDQVLARAVQPLNKIIKKYAPKTVGHCAYPAGGVPLPCFEYGILALVQQDMYRITAMWMAGLDTIRLTNISMKQTLTLARDSSKQASSPTTLHHYSLHLEGVLEVPSIFLKIEVCPKNHTTLKPVLGQGLCKPFLDTGDSIQETHRHWSVELSADCHDGDRGLQNLNISSFQMDTMTVRPHMEKKNFEVLIANKNITKMVVETVSANVMFYFTNATFAITGEEYDAEKLLNRVLRFNALHQEFHCR